MNNLQEPLLVTLDEAARRLGVSLSTVSRLVRNGKLRAVRFGQKCTRIPVAELVAIANSSNVSAMAGGQAERSLLE